MAIDVNTVSLLNSVLSATGARKLFETIATRRIAEKFMLRAEGAEVDRELHALTDADLIGAGANGDKYFVTAKGLRVARDLEKLPI